MNLNDSIFRSLAVAIYKFRDLSVFVVNYEHFIVKPIHSYGWDFRYDNVVNI